MITWRDRVGRAVFEVYLLTACVLIGVIGIVAPAARARSIIAAFPGWAQTAWYVLLLTGGILAFTGLVRGSDIGLMVERAAMLVLAGLCASFGFAAVALSGPPALTASMMLLAFTATCLVRAHQLTGELAALRAEVRRIVSNDRG